MLPGFLKGLKMSNVKNDIMKMIKKRQSYNRTSRIKTVQDLGPKGIVLQCVNALGALRDRMNKPDFGIKIKNVLDKLVNNVKLLDVEADVNIQWSDEDTITISYVTITWGEGYVEENNIPDIFVFDVVKYYLEGAFF